jgi:hypothetical protein
MWWRLSAKKIGIILGVGVTGHVEAAWKTLYPTRLTGVGGTCGFLTPNRTSFACSLFKLDNHIRVLLGIRKSAYYFLDFISHYKVKKVEK